jgi:HEAT repeat protein
LDVPIAIDLGACAMSLRIMFLHPIILVVATGLLAGQEADRASDEPDPRATAAIDLWTAGDSSSRHRALRRLLRLGPRAAPAVPTLIGGLGDPDPKIRQESADVLHRVGPTANPAVPALINALQDPDRNVRSAAGLALTTTKPDPKQVIPALVAGLHAAPDRHCPTAVYVLGNLGEPGVPVLIGLLQDSDTSLRHTAAESLGQTGRAAKPYLTALVEALRSQDREVRQHVAAALAGIGPEAVESLIRALRDRDPKVRGGAACALEGLRAQAAPAVPALLAALADPEEPDDPSPRRRSSIDDWEREDEPQPSGYYATLRAIGAAAVPTLLERLDGPDQRGRIIALRALGFISAEAKAAVPRLVALLSDRELRLESAGALGGIGPAAGAAVLPLIACLKDPDPVFRARAAESLGRIGWERQAGQYSTETVARGAIAPLTAALADADSRVRTAAARALGDIGSESSSAIAKLAALFSDPSAEVRQAALGTFAGIGKPPRSSQATVVGLLKDADARVRLAAAKLIGDLNSELVVSALVAALNDPDADVRAMVASRLARANGQKGLLVRPNAVIWGDSTRGDALARSPVAAAALRAALADPDARVRTMAAHALPIFRREAAASVPLLTARLKDRDVLVRVASAMALGQFGPDAQSAVPVLLEALADPDGISFNDYSVGAKAAQALQVISPDARTRMFDRLLALLADPDEGVRGAASAALLDLGTAATSRLIQTFTDAKTPRTVQVEVLGILAAGHGVGSSPSGDEPEPLGPAFQPALPILRALSRDDDRTVRDESRRLLAAAEPGGESAARTLLDAARDEEPNYTTIDETEETLEPTAAAVLIAALNDPNEDVRTIAADALGALGLKLPRPDDEVESAPPAPAEVEARNRGLRLRTQYVDVLVPALKDRDTQVRWAAAWALYRLGTGEKAVSALTEMLKDKSTRVRAGAHIRLPAAVGWVRWCEVPADGVLLRVVAIQALGGFGASASPAISALADALKDDDRLIRWIAVDSVAKIGPTARGAVPELIGLLRSKDIVRSAQPFPVMLLGPVRLADEATKALDAIGTDARAAVTALTEALADPDLTLRDHAAHALGAIGAAAGAAAPALVRALEAPESWVGDNVAAALGRIGEPAVPALIEALKSPNPEVRRRAMRALGGVGRHATAALAALRQRLMDSDPDVRRAAEAAIKAITTPDP